MGKAHRPAVAQERRYVVLDPEAIWRLDRDLRDEGFAQCRAGYLLGVEDDHAHPDRCNLLAVEVLLEWLAHDRHSEKNRRILRGAILYGYAWGRADGIEARAIFGDFEAYHREREARRLERSAGQTGKDTKP